LAKREDIGFGALFAIYGNVLLVATAVVAISFGAAWQVSRAPWRSRRRYAS
jgi:hypothetical protein